MNGLVTFSMCLHEYVHFADFAFDGEMSDDETLELPATARLHRVVINTLKMIYKIKSPFHYCVERAF